MYSCRNYSVSRSLGSTKWSSSSDWEPFGLAEIEGTLPTSLPTSIADWFFRMAGLGPMKLVCGWRERSPNFSESSLLSFACSKFMRALSVDPLKLVNMTSGKSNFYLLLPKLVAIGEISSFIRFLLSSFWSLPNFYSELERLRSRSLSRSLYWITRECMD